MKHELKHNSPHLSLRAPTYFWYLCQELGGGVEETTFTPRVGMHQEVLLGMETHPALVEQDTHINKTSSFRQNTLTYLFCRWGL